MHFHIPEGYISNHHQVVSNHHQNQSDMQDVGEQMIVISSDGSPVKSSQAQEKMIITHDPVIVEDHAILNQETVQLVTESGIITQHEALHHAGNDSPPSPQVCSRAVSSLFVTIL